MAIVVKCFPGNVSTDNTFISEPVPIAKNCAPIVGDEAFVWHTDEAVGRDGLAMHGTLVNIDGKPKAGGRQKFSMTIKVDADKARPTLTISDLERYDERKSGVPKRPDDLRHKLCKKLLAHSLRRVAPLDPDEAEYLRRFFSHSTNARSVRPSPDFPSLSEADNHSRDRKSITPQDTGTASDGIAGEIEIAERRRTQELIFEDLASAFEGLPKDQKIKMLSRERRLADNFIRHRIERGALSCDNCGFDPASKVAGTVIPPRSLLDVHHKNPLRAGVRKTELADFSLLCPNCHRLVHVKIRTRILS